MSERYGSEYEAVISRSRNSADFYAKFKAQKGYFKSDVKGVGEEAFSGPSAGAVEYMLVFRKGNRCVTLTSFFNLGGPASKPLMLTKEQLIELGKVVAGRLYKVRPVALYPLNCLLLALPWNIDEVKQLVKNREKG